MKKFAAFALAGSSVAALLVLRSRRKRALSAGAARRLAALRARDGRALTGDSGVHYNAADAPAWLRPLFSDPSLRRVLCREWEDDAWRAAAGWRGRDLIHDPRGEGVVARAYFWDAAREALAGVVSFGPRAESHRGLCHGGAMTSLMDDVCGHACFLAGNAPWCGATVQVNCKLTKPVRVGDVLRVDGRVARREESKSGSGRAKLFVSARLVGEDGSVYAELDGVSITPVPMASADDAVSRREWLDDARVLRDSGWLLP